MGIKQNLYIPTTGISTNIYKSPFNFKDKIKETSIICIISCCSRLL